MDLVGKRKQLLNYLKTHDIERYRAIIGKLVCASKPPGAGFRGSGLK
jgi:ribosomal protein S15P/S13E